MGGTARIWSGRARLIRLGLVAVIAWVLVLALAAPAHAHPFLLFTNPELDGAVPDSPESVTLVFNESVTVNTQALTITDSNDNEVGSAPPKTEQGGKAITAAVTEKLEPGVYRVRWEVTGVDGHGAEGEFRFAVGTVITGAEAGGASNSQPTDWPSAGIRWLLLAGFAVAFGGIIGQRLIARVRRNDDSLPKVRSWAPAGASLGLVATAAAAAALILDVGASALWDSTPGRVILADAVGFGVALVLLVARRPVWALLPLVAVALSEGFGSHSEVELPGVGALLTATHLAAAGLWTGALLQIGRAAVRWRSTRPAVRRLLLVYARMAAWLFVLVALTGLTMALLLVPIPALTGTGYGRSLLVKLALVALVAVLALVGRWTLRTGRIRRVTSTARVEAATLVVVLAATATLVSTPTPGSFAAPPPPPPQGVAVPAGGLAGWIGVNVVASEGQVVVRLATPKPGNEFKPNESPSPEYTLSGHFQSASGARRPVQFRSCGASCFVASLDWADGDNVLSLRADASGWPSGEFAALIPWPARPAKDLVKRTARVMGNLERVTLYEAVTSNGTAGLPQPTPISLSGEEFLDSVPYSSGVAPIAAKITTESGATKLLMGFPAAATYTTVTLDNRGRIIQETLAVPNHLIKRRFEYESDD